MLGRTRDWFAPRLIFEVRLPSGEFVRKEFPQQEKFQKGEFIRGLNEPDFEKMVARAANGDPCFKLAFFDRSSFLREITQMAGPTLNTFKVGGYLEYWGASSDSPITVPVTGSGTVLQDSSRQECH